MRRRRVIGGLGGSVAAALVAAVALVIALPAGGNVALAPPAPCPSPQIIDATGTADGHHPGTNIKAAWLSVDGGPLRAVIQVVQGVWTPAHEPIAGYAFIFTVDGQARFVRVTVTSDGEEAYDYGTYAGTSPFFTPEGATTGTREGSVATDGTAVIDVPTGPMNIDPGDQLTGLFVLTYESVLGDDPHWVDRGPGGTTPAGTEFGADYVVGSCSAVGVNTPASVQGTKTVTISGQVEPAAEGVDVAITRETKTGAPVVVNTTTDASGTYSVPLKIRETSTIRAEANGIESTTKTITMRSVVTIKAVRLANGTTRINGLTNPWLPGRVQLFKTTAFTPSATKQIQGGAFSFTPRRLRPGRYQVIYTPRDGRAVRDISNTVRVR